MISAFFHVFGKCGTLGTAFVMVVSAAIALFVRIFIVMLEMAFSPGVLQSFRWRIISLISVSDADLMDPSSGPPCSGTRLLYPSSTSSFQSSSLSDCSFRWNWSSMKSAKASALSMSVYATSFLLDIRGSEIFYFANAFAFWNRLLFSVLSSSSLPRQLSLWNSLSSALTVQAV